MRRLTAAAILAAALTALVAAPTAGTLAAGGATPQGVGCCVPD
ncbi:MAG: hypothetical protein ACJ74O_15950 [Frankiaceae bacterium]